MTKKQAPTQQDFITVAEAAEELGLTPRRIRYMITDEHLFEVIKLSGETAPYLINRKSFEDYKEKRDQSAN
jgi:predicted transcriptional regulator